MTNKPHITWYEDILPCIEKSAQVHGPPQGWALQDLSPGFATPDRRGREEEDDQGHPDHCCTNVLALSLESDNIHSRKSYDGSGWVDTAKVTKVERKREEKQSLILEINFKASASSAVLLLLRLLVHWRALLQLLATCPNLSLSNPAPNSSILS